MSVERMYLMEEGQQEEQLRVEGGVLNEEHRYGPHGGWRDQADIARSGSLTNKPPHPRQHDADHWNGSGRNESSAQGNGTEGRPASVGPVGDRPDYGPCSREDAADPTVAFRSGKRKHEEESAERDERETRPVSAFSKVRCIMVTDDHFGKCCTRRSN